MTERFSPPVAPRIDRGSATTDATGDATVTFVRPFKTSPIVFLQGIDSAAKGIVLDVTSVSTTGFTVKARKTTGITSGSAGDHVHSTIKALVGSVRDPTFEYRLRTYASDGIGDGEELLSYFSTVGHYTSKTGVHSHTVNAPVLAVDFNWLAIEV